MTIVWRLVFDGKFCSMDTIKATYSVKLLKWESSNFAWNVPISRNDCKKYNENYPKWLKTTDISSYESTEMFDVINPGINMMK